MEKINEIEKIGKYKTLSFIGKGGSGRVFKAINTITGQIVAIKQIKISKQNEKLLTSEINFFQSIKHKNILEYIEHFEENNYMNIILNYIEGGSLADIIKKTKNLSEKLLKKIIYNILKGLKYLHSQKIIHRDIKGANILLEKNGIPKIADFGVTKIEDNKFKSFVGTPYWMAPEMINPKNPGTTSIDIWSIGCTIIEGLTGKPPYSYLDHYPAFFRIVQDKHPPLPENISEECKDLLLKCFFKDPKERPSAEDLLKHKWFFDLDIFENKGKFLEDENLKILERGNNLIDKFYKKEFIKLGDLNYLKDNFFCEKNIFLIDRFSDFSFIWDFDRYDKKDISLVKIDLIELLIFISEKKSDFVVKIINKGLLNFVFNIMKLDEEEPELYFKCSYFLGKILLIDKKNFSNLFISSCYIYKFTRIIDFTNLEKIIKNAETLGYAVYVCLNCFYEIILENVSLFVLKKILNKNILLYLMIWLNLELNHSIKEKIDDKIFEIIIFIIKKITNEQSYNLLKKFFVCDHFIETLIQKLKSDLLEPKLLSKLLIIVYKLNDLKNFRIKFIEKGLLLIVIKISIFEQEQLKRKNLDFDLQLEILRYSLAIIDLLLTVENPNNIKKEEKNLFLFFGKIKGVEFLKKMFLENFDSKIRSFIFQIWISIGFFDRELFMKFNEFNFEDILKQILGLDSDFELKLMSFRFFKSFLTFFQKNDNLLKLYENLRKDLNYNKNQLTKFGEKILHDIE